MSRQPALSPATDPVGFHYRDGVLHVDEVPLPRIADAVGTPTYVYSAPAIRQAYRRLEAAFAPLSPELHYAVKASPNMHLCRLLHELGAGMDVVSGGEMERAWLAGVPMEEIVFAGVGKTDDEIRAALDGRFSELVGSPVLAGRDPSGRGTVGLFNVESVSELERIAALGEELGLRPKACLRANPNVDPETHEYTTTGKQENKFGIDAPLIADLFDAWADHPGIEIVGVHVHIGSPVPKVHPYVSSIEVVLALIDEIEGRGHRFRLLDLGGGWPVDYRDDEVPPIEAYAEAVVPLLEERVRGGMKLVLEPGRYLLANSGVLLSRVQHLKHGRARTFVIGDAGMHSLLRPSLYRVFHFIWPVQWQGESPSWSEDPGLPGLRRCDVVGPICETGDYLARDRLLPEVARGDLLAVFSAGAYGMSMASNYNDHGRPAEVLVDGTEITVINERQSLGAVLATETAPRRVELEHEEVEA